MLLAAATSSSWWQQLLALPLRLITIVAVASLIHFLGSRMIRRAVTKWIEAGKQRDAEAPVAPEATVELQHMILTQRRSQRAVALGQLLRNLLILVVWGTAVLLTLTEVGVNIGPIMASAGVVGVALGFGAQTLVKDYLSGFFLIIEDQYGVGDVVDLGVGGVVGTIEEVSLRVTRMRDASGVVWYVRNGEILRVANQSQGWTMATAVIPVAYDADLDEVREIVREIGVEMYNDPETQAQMLGKPIYGGVDAVSGDAVFVRVSAKAKPTQQVALTRELRERLKNALDHHGIRVPVVGRPQQYGPDWQPLPPGSPPPTAAL